MNKSKLVKSIIAVALCFMFSVQAFALEGPYATLQIGNPNYAAKSTLSKEASIRPLDNDSTEVTPIIRDGSTMLPISATASAIRVIDDWLEISWDANEKRIDLLEADRRGTGDVFFASFWVGSNKMVYYKDGNARDIDKEVTLSPAPVIINERTYFPIRAVADAFSVNIEWVPSKKAIIIFRGDRPSKVVLPDGSNINF